MERIDSIVSSTPIKAVEDQTKPIRRFILKVLNDWTFDLSSMIGYSLILSLLPLCITLFGIIAFALRTNPQSAEDLKDKLINSFPSDNTTQSGIKQIVDLAFDQLSSNAGGIFAIGFVLAIFSSTRLFISIDKSFTIIYRLEERSFLRQNLMALSTLFIFVLIVGILLFASSIPTVVINLIPGGGSRFGIYLGGIIVSLAIGFVLFQIIYKLIPNQKMSFKKSWCGALIAAAFLEIFIILFPLYVRTFLSNYAGQIGFAVILILFFYYFSIILLIGAQINAFFFEKCQPFDVTLGTYLSRLSKQDEQINQTMDEQNENNHNSISKSMNRCCSWNRRKSISPLSITNNNNQT